MLYFADRVGSNWLPEFHDFAIVFLSETLLNNEKALLCLGRAKTAFPNMVGIDLYNSLSDEMMEEAHRYCKRIFSLDEGKEFLLTTFPEIASAFDLETKQLTESIETDGYKYLDETIDHLNHRESVNKRISIVCYGLSFIVLFLLLIFLFWRFCIFTSTEIDLNLQKTIVLCIEVVVLSALAISVCRFLFLLGKSFMVNTFIRNHAKPLGNAHFLNSHPMRMGTFDKI